MNDFYLTAGHVLNQMRLITEGAIVLYESDILTCYQEANRTGKQDTTQALDMLGTALYTLRQQICALQEEGVKTNS